MAGVVCLVDGIELLPGSSQGEWYCPECLSYYHLFNGELILVEEYPEEEE
jgi:hypothetical protein